MIKLLLPVLIISQLQFILDEANPRSDNKIYKMNHKIEIPLSLGVFAVNALGLYVLNEKDPLNSNQVASLNKQDINIFDRIAVEQTYDAAYHKNIRTTSDWIRNSSIFLPSLLFLDKNIRKDIYNIIFLYIETQAVSSTLYAYAGITFIDRIRPFVYYPEVPLESKIESNSGAKNSFFSGHTSATATASFFLAKVYLDYNPMIKTKKMLLYTSAIIPPALVGYYRYKALRHFPSDILMGIIVGAAAGILIPELHKVKFGKNNNISVIPLNGNSVGLSFNINW